MENRREKKRVILKRKGMLIAAITLLICIFSNTSLARQTEIPEDLILEKELSINKLELGAPINRTISWTKPGIYYWTVPAGVTRIRVAVVGGGGGGSVASGKVTSIGGTGGTSSIDGYISATGGTGGHLETVYGSHNSGIFDSSIMIEGKGGSPNGRNGTYWGDWNENESGFIQHVGIGWSMGFSGASGPYGEGGQARHRWNVYNVWIASATGGSGGYNTGYISVSPGQVLTIRVGEGGKGSMVMGAGGDGCSVTNGNAGYVYMEYTELQLGITLGSNYESEQDRVQLAWNVDYGSNYIYKLYQRIDGGAESIVSTTMNKNHTVTKADKTGPSAPSVTAQKRSDNSGNDLTFTASTDKGTRYTHRVETTTSGTTYRSNTTTTTATSGIRGYQYAITPNVNYTLPAPNNSNVVALSSIPTFVSGENEAIQYIYIRAVDKEWNVSGTTRVLLQVPVKITLTSDYEYGKNYVPLSWKINDTRAGYLYKLFRNGEDVTKETNNYTRTLISSTPGELSYTTVGTHEWKVPEGVESITVTAVGAGGGGSGNCTTQIPNAPTEIFTETGSHTWKVPQGVYQIKVTIAGAGGAGGRIEVVDYYIEDKNDGRNIDFDYYKQHGITLDYMTNADIMIAGNGGNGDKKEITMDVTPGQTYNIYVGKGGEKGYYYTTRTSGL